MNLPRTLRALAPALSLALAACLDPLSQVAGGGIGGTGISVVGVVTGFGSVFVSGVEYMTSGTTAYQVDTNSQAAQGDLKIGMVVTLTGNVAADGTLNAGKIVYSPTVKGPVTCNTDGTLTVLTQTVKLDSKPTLDGFDCQTGNGKVVDVSGLHDASGVIHATRVGLAGASQQGSYEAHGTVANLVNTVAQQTFTIGALTINFSGATRVPATLANGQQVEVTGTLAAAPNTINATSVSIDQEDSEPSDTRAGVEGLITAVKSSTTIQVGNRTVITNSGTKITDTNNATLTSNQLTVGWRVQVLGKFDDNGNIVASQVHREQ